MQQHHVRVVVMESCLVEKIIQIGQIKRWHIDIVNYADNASIHPFHHMASKENKNNTQPNNSTEKNGTNKKQNKDWDTFILFHHSFVKNMYNIFIYINNLLLLFLVIKNIYYAPIDTILFYVSTPLSLSSYSSTLFRKKEISLTVWQNV